MAKTYILIALAAIDAIGNKSIYRPSPARGLRRHGPKRLGMGIVPRYGAIIGKLFILFLRLKRRQ